MAKLKIITIENFRNVNDRIIDLTESENVITGHNMTGKTNTLNAIHWALTGASLDGSNDNRANFDVNAGKDLPISVELQFDTFTFERQCTFEDGAPKVSVFFNGDEYPIKKGEALLHKELGLTDIILKQPKDFNILKFLLNPLYFDTISPSALRKFLYMLSNTDFAAIARNQSAAVNELVFTKYGEIDPYKLADAVSKDKKATKKILDGCKTAKELFPSVTKEAEEKEKEVKKKLISLESDEALVEKYALSVSKYLNKYYEKALGIKVCMLEKGVGDDVFLDVCYPILPKSNLPFHAGSQAEKTFVGMKFINEVCLKWNIKPIVILLDNMESLDANTRKFVDSLGVQYIGAYVID